MSILDGFFFFIGKALAELAIGAAAIVALVLGLYFLLYLERKQVERRIKNASRS